MSKAYEEIWPEVQRSMQDALLLMAEIETLESCTKEIVAELETIAFNRHDKQLLMDVTTAINEQLIMKIADTCEALVEDADAVEKRCGYGP